MVWCLRSQSPGWGWGRPNPDLQGTARVASPPSSLVGTEQGPNKGMLCGLLACGPKPRGWTHPEVPLGRETEPHRAGARPSFTTFAPCWVFRTLAPEACRGDPSPRRPRRPPSSFRGTRSLRGLKKCSCFSSDLLGLSSWASNRSKRQVIGMELNFHACARGAHAGSTRRRRLWVSDEGGRRAMGP